MRKEEIKRRIVDDNPEIQVQREDDILYFYRKDYLLHGDQEKVYSLALLYLREVGDDEKG